MRKVSGSMPMARKACDQAPWLGGKWPAACMRPARWAARWAAAAESEGRGGAAGRSWPGGIDRIKARAGSPLASFKGGGAKMRVRSLPIGPASGGARRASHPSGLSTASAT